MTTLYIARHGETIENSQHILQGHMPGHLTPLGIEQAQRLRDELRSVHFDALLCSDLQRCIDTAAIVAEPHQQSILYTRLLRERDWGDLTGASIPTLDRSQPFPANVETEAALLKRASIFLRFVADTYPDKTVLAVSHGLFCRFIQAAHSGKSIRQVERMCNAEVRVLQV